jgi:hypothetical protein
MHIKLNIQGVTKRLEGNHLVNESAFLFGVEKIDKM